MPFCNEVLPSHFTREVLISLHSHVTHQYRCKRKPISHRVQTIYFYQPVSAHRVLRTVLQTGRTQGNKTLVIHVFTETRRLGNYCYRQGKHIRTEGQEVIKACGYWSDKHNCTHVWVKTTVTYYDHPQDTAAYRPVTYCTV